MSQQNSKNIIVMQAHYIGNFQFNSLKTETSSQLSNLITNQFYHEAKFPSLSDAQATAMSIIK
jgi:hypothetical protein